MSKHKTFIWLTRFLIVAMLLSLLQLAVPPKVALAIDGVYHNPYGQDDLYSTEPTERSPRDPKAGETVYINLTTWPVEWGQAAWITWTKNGIAQADIGATWQYNSGNNSYWRATMGPFAKGDNISYTVHANKDGANEKTIGPFSFKVTDWSTVTNVTGYTNNTNYVQITLGDAAGNFNPALRIAFTSEQVFRVQFAPTGNGLTATGLANYTVTSDATYITISTSSLALKIQKTPYRLFVYKADGTTLIAKEHDPTVFRNFEWLTDGSSIVTKIGEHFYTPTNEKFFGFGEKYDALDQRGKDVNIYTVDQYLNHGAKTYLPIPFFINSAGYGIYLNTTYYSVFNIATYISTMYGFTRDTGGSLSSILDYYFINGPNPKDIITRYTDITGKPALPPKWVFGPWMSANEWDKQSEAQTQIDNTTTYSIPATVLVLEAWSDEATYYIWNDAQYTPKPGSQTFAYTDFTFPSGGRWPDPRTLVNNAHNRGIKVLLWQAPVEKYLGFSHTQKDNDETYMLQQGYAVGDGSGGAYRIPSGRWFANSLVPDFTHTAGTSWWTSKRDYLFNMNGVGIDGFKTDGGEYIYGRNLTFANGKKGDEMRNAYPGTYMGAYYNFVQTKTGNNGILLSRAGSAGAQAYPATWSGDEQSTFSAFQDSIRAGLSASMSGVPFWGWDLAGFSGDIPTKELYLRGAAMSAFVPVMEFHSETSGDPNPSQARSPWNMEARLADSQARTGFAKFANIHMNLLPYAYSEAKQTSLTGVPMMRSMFLEYPNDTTAVNQTYQYMYGSQLLVAPVETQGATTKSVYLPRGEWIDLWNGGQHSGPTTVNYGVSDLETIPVFVKAGAILPLNLDNNYALGGYVGNSMTGYTQLTFAIYPFGTSSYTWFDDLNSATKTITSTEDYLNNKVTIDLPPVSVVSTLLVNTTQPSSVTVDGSALTQYTSFAAFQAAANGWYYDPVKQDIYVKVGSSTSTRSIVLNGVNKPAYEAEFEVLTAVTTNINHPGYTGTGFVDGFETQGDAVTFDGVEVSQDATYELRFRYSAANAGGATRTVYANGQKAGQLTLPQTANWDTWATASISGNLYKGKTNTVKISFDSGDSGPINLDNLMIVPWTRAAREYFQEEAMLGNGYAFAQMDARGTLYDLQYPLGIYTGIVVDGADASGTQGVQVNIAESMAGIEVDGRTYWLNHGGLWTCTQSYITDTAVVKSEATHVNANVKVTQYGFVPDGITWPNTTGGNPIRGLYIKRIVVQNTSTTARDISLLYYTDMNINGAAAQDSVSYQATEKALYFYDGGDSASGRTRTMAFGLYVKSTGPLTAESNQLYSSDGAGYLKKTANIAAGATQEFDVLLVGATSTTMNASLYSSDIVPAITWFNDQSAASLETTTENTWTTLLANATSLETPSATYNTNFKRSIIATVLSFNKDTGGVAAGFHNGAYSYNWPRDGVYAAMTLDRVGIHDLPTKLYDWLWNKAERDVVGHDIGNDGVYYRFWYQKYTMDGIRAWEQPQIDQTAIIPFGVKFHYDLTGDTTFRTTYYPMVKEAAFVSSENNPHPGLDYNEAMHLMFSYNLWEDMWGMFLYSNAAVVAGLDAAQTIAGLEGDTPNQQTFISRRDDIKNTGILLSVPSNNTTSPGLYSSDYNRFYMTKDLKKWYTDPSNIWNAITTDASMLGIVVPFKVLPDDDPKVVNTVNELEPALTDVNETHSAVGGVVRYRQDQVSRYGSVYANFGDTYYDGGPWMVATAWLSDYYLARANTTTGKTYVDKAKAYTDWIFSYMDNLGIGAEQVDEYKSPGTFAHQAAWGNGWESNASIVDNLMYYIDYTYDAPSNTFKAWPKLPTGWNYIGSNVVLKNGKMYVKDTQVTSNQHQVILTNNTASNLTVEIYIQTDANPTSVTGTTLSWSYNATNGRVKLYGTLNASASQTVTINY
ncbi:MAG: TIM-barrel domain-containing protein [Chloroflexota bacterium]